MPSPTTALLRAVWAASPRDAWAVGADVLRWDGVAWTRITDPQLAGNRFAGDEWYSAWGVGAEVWLGGYNRLARFDGKAWTIIDPLPQSLSCPYGGLWGSKSDDLWAGCGTAGYGKVARWNGRMWAATAIDYPITSVQGLWGLAGDELWLAGGCDACGKAGEIRRWDGTAWRLVDYGTFSWPAFSGMWAAGRGDVWFVRPGFLHWDGQAWKRYPSLGGDEKGIWGRASNDVFVVGSGGLTAHWNGAECAAPGQGHSPRPLRRRRHLRRRVGRGRPGDDPALRAVAVNSPAGLPERGL